MDSTFHFSSEDRQAYIDKSINLTYDLLIIGGGITGAGIALDAVSRGLSVCLIEKHDYAWGTSSRSTKLIHGGLRYLKQLEIGLVKEVGTERAIVHNNAKNLVVPEKMLLPIVDNGSLGYYSTSLALFVYDFLAGVRKKESRIMLPAEKTLKAEPLLHKDNIKGGGLYYEYRTDDSRLTIEVIKKAVSLGATCINYAEYTKGIYENNRLSGGEIKDKITRKKFNVKAKQVVNATGPWVDLVRKKDNSLKGKRLQLTKGVHLVFPYNSFPLRQAIYFDVEGDDRMIFAIPRQGKTYVGTTDTVYNEDIDRPTTTASDVAYILDAVNYMFPNINLTASVIESSWAGLRPLIYEDGKLPSELSRKDELFLSKSGLLSIAGGKLTGYRKMAERVVDKVLEHIEDKNKGASKTKNLALFGCDFESFKDIQNLIIKLTSEHKKYHLNVNIIKEWIYRYGTETKVIVNTYLRLIKQHDDYELCIVLAELDYCIEKESVIKLEDFYIRRSAKLYFNLPQLDKYLYTAADYLKLKLSYTTEEIEEQLETLANYKKEALGFKN